MQLGDINFAAQNAGNSFTVLQEICVVPPRSEIGGTCPRQVNGAGAFHTARQAPVQGCNKLRLLPHPNMVTKIKPLPS